MRQCWDLYADTKHSAVGDQFDVAYPYTHAHAHPRYAASDDGSCHTAARVLLSPHQQRQVL